MGGLVFEMAYSTFFVTYVDEFKWICFHLGRVSYPGFRKGNPETLKIVPQTLL